MEKIKNKIFSLLQKTVENGCTEEEQQAAQAKAAELMASYGVEAGEALGRGLKCVSVKIPAFINGVAEISGLFGCTAFVDTGGVKILGRADRVELAAYFVEAMVKQRETALRKVGRASNPKWNAQFRLGFTLKYFARVKQMYQASVQEYGLVPVGKVTNEEAAAFFGRKIETHKGRDVDAVNCDALHYGMEAGATAEIARPLN